jgi:CheY-like chemotaxis protein
VFRRPLPPRPKVLHIEDDDDLWKLVHRRLGHQWELVRAASDVEACVLMRDLGPAIACVLTDLNLGGSALSGVELIRLIRGTMPLAQTPMWARELPIARQIPIIVTTGSDTHLSQASQAGATRVLIKPFDFAALQDVLRRHAPPAAPPMVPSALPRPSPG